MKVATVLCVLAAATACLAAPWRKQDLTATQALDQCKIERAPRTQANELKILANASTVHWGFQWQWSKPLATAISGDEMYIEMVTHHGGDDIAAMITGDPGMESIYRWVSEDDMALSQRGATDRSDGAHLMTGPIWICGAEEGDVLQIDILDLQPRKNPSTGKAWASNAATWWGYQFRAGFKDNDRRESVTIYEVLDESDPAGNPYISPVYQYRWNETTEGFNGAITPCTPTEGYVTGWNGTTLMDMNWTYSNPDRRYGRGNIYPCVDGKQNWKGMDYRGMLVNQDPSKGPVPKKVDVKGSFKMPAKIHPGNMAVAMKNPVPVSTIPPGIWGGNMDQRRLNKGTTLFVQVQVLGALFTMGDAHLSQGDSELDGTAAEASVNARVKFTLHKKDKLPKIVQNLRTPLISTPNEFIIQGGAYENYLEDIPGQNVFALGADLNKAMNVTYRATRDWMMNVFGWSEDLTATAITVGVDFGVSQVVDGNWGMHALIPKKFFPVPGFPEVPDLSACPEKECPEPVKCPEPVTCPTSGALSTAMSAPMMLLGALASVLLLAVAAF